MLCGSRHVIVYMQRRDIHVCIWKYWFTAHGSSLSYVPFGDETEQAHLDTVIMAGYPLRGMGNLKYPRCRRVIPLFGYYPTYHFLSTVQEGAI